MNVMTITTVKTTKTSAVLMTTTNNRHDNNGHDRYHHECADGVLHKPSTAKPACLSMATSTHAVQVHIN